MVDPGLEMAYDEGNRTFTITATTGISAWTWLDYPRGAVV
jgi:beta-mannosidase